MNMICTLTVCICILHPYKSAACTYCEFQFRNSNRVMSDDEVIQDTIELETSSCNCRNQFTGYRIDEGKYRVSGPCALETSKGIFGLRLSVC